MEQEQITNELSYFFAAGLIETLRKQGLLTDDEASKIMKLNVKKYQPATVYI